MKNQDNKPNLYRRIMHKYTAFYNKNLKKIFRVRADIFAHIIAIIFVFVGTYITLTLTGWGASDNLDTHTTALAAGILVAFGKEVFDQLTGYGNAQVSDLVAGIATSAACFTILELITNFQDTWIVTSFIVFMIVMKFVIWGRNSNL